MGTAQAQQAQEEARWETWFREARAGDAHAARELALAARPMLTRVAYAFLRHPDDADDVAQEALVRALTRAFVFRGGRSAQAFLLRTVANLARNRLRDQKRRNALLARAEHEGQLPLPAVPADPATPLAEVQQRAQIEGLLAQLGERQQAVLRLRIFGELPFADVARLLGMTEANARVTYANARQRLSALWEQEKTR